MKYVMEHMEEELFEWSALEYSHFVHQVGADKALITNLDVGKLSPREQGILSRVPHPIPSHVILKESVRDLGFIRENPARVCLLDEKGHEVLSPTDADLFDYVVFGGILGDDPPKDDSKVLRDLEFTCRNLEAEQMTMDTAAIVSYRILEGKTPISSLSFISRPDFNISKNESVNIPFRYLASDHDPAKPLVAPGIVKIAAEWF